MPTARWGLAAVTAPDGRIFALGGVSRAGTAGTGAAGTGASTGGALTTVEAYDPRTGAWTARAPMPTPHGAFGAVLDGNGRIDVFGGGSPCAGTLSRAAEVYDPVTDTWRALPPMLSARGGVAAAVGPAGRIFLFGGTNTCVRGRENALRRVDVFDPRTGVWKKAARMPDARTHAAAVPGPDGRIYLLGGLDGTGHLVGTVQAYDPADRSWTEVAWHPLGPVAAVRIGGQIFVLEGDHRTEAFDPAHATWTDAAPMPSARTGEAAAVRGGRIYAIGGIGSGGRALPTVEMYRPGPQFLPLTVSPLPSTLDCGGGVTLTVQTQPAATVRWTVQDGDQTVIPGVTDGRGAAALYFRPVCTRPGISRIVIVSVTATSGGRSVSWGGRLRVVG